CPRVLALDGALPALLSAPLVLDETEHVLLHGHQPRQDDRLIDAFKSPFRLDREYIALVQQVRELRILDRYPVGMPVDAVLGDGIPKTQPLREASQAVPVRRDYGQSHSGGRTSTPVVVGEPTSAHFRPLELSE